MPRGTCACRPAKNRLRISKNPQGPSEFLSKQNYRKLFMTRYPNITGKVRKPSGCHAASMLPGFREFETASCTKASIDCIFCTKAPRLGNTQAMHSLNSRKSSAWLWIVLAWLGLGLANATQIVLGMRAEGMKYDWAAIYLTCLFSWAVWALATPLIVRLGRRFPP